MTDSVRAQTPRDAEPPTTFIEVLGGLRVTVDGLPRPLPKSRKTRALLAYLLLSDRPRRREHLCEIFWEEPDDPRGALRWALSRLRAGLAGCDLTLIADRDAVQLAYSTQALDVASIRELMDRPERELDLEALRRAATQLRSPLLEGVDLHGAPTFQAWLTSERDEVAALRSRVLARICHLEPAAGAQVLPWVREWVESDPANPAAQARLQQALDERQAGLAAEPTPHTGGQRFATPTSPAPGSGRQAIRFCTASDGVRIAYAAVGEGPPLIKAANWLSHLEYDWDSPVWAPMFQALSQEHTFIRYDERGNGLSDWGVEDLSFEAFVRDLETVADATGVARFPLLGISQGCAVAISYAARHPERVSHLILSGGYASGWRVTEPELTVEREAVITLVKHGWGRDDPAYRQIFSSTFMPSATSDELAWFNEFQRRTASAENAARFLEVFSRIDVRADLPKVRAPTLVVHARGDRRIPLSIGREIAAGIPDAQFAVLETDNHMLLGREPAAQVFLAAVRGFLGA